MHGASYDAYRCQGHRFATLQEEEEEEEEEEEDSTLDTRHTTLSISTKTPCYASRPYRNIPLCADM